MLSEHIMDKSPPVFDSRNTLALRISPWTRQLPDLAPEFAVALDVAWLTVSRELIGDWRVRLAGLRALCAAVLPLVSDFESRVTFEFSGVDIDAMQFSQMLDNWTDVDVPVHALIAFDFAARPPRGPILGAKSHGLAPLIGQEVACWPSHNADRLTAARMTVRVAHHLLVNGPVAERTRVPGPDGGPSYIELTPDKNTPPTVHIEL